MLKPIRVTNIELSHPFTTIDNLSDDDALQALVRLHGIPIGYVKIPVIKGRCAAAALSNQNYKQIRFYETSDLM